MTVSSSSFAGLPAVSPSTFERIKNAGSWAINKTLLGLQSLVTLVWARTSALMTSRYGPIAVFSTLAAGGVYIFYTRHADADTFQGKLLGIFILIAAFAAGLATGRVMYLARA